MKVVQTMKKATRSKSILVYARSVIIPILHFVLTLAAVLPWCQAKFKSKTGATTVEQDDNGTGYWLGAGTYWAVGPQLNLGLDIRYSHADVTLFNIEREAGGVHTGMFVGYHC